MAMQYYIYLIIFDRNVYCLCTFIKQATCTLLSSTLVFTSNGAIVGVVIRGVDQYDQVTIKPTDGSKTPIPCMNPSLTCTN